MNAPRWKDTIKTYAGYVTRVIAKFDLPPGRNSTPGQEFATSGTATCWNTKTTK